ncbi:MAG: HAD-IC family P-type ATPase, partial [Clostridiales bacterium]|nr:HAD-IC family P-type ATPase [Clostridiales bacterium]
IAKSIQHEYEAGGKNHNLPTVVNFQEIGGQGLKGLLNDAQISAGNHRLMEENNIEYLDYNGFGTVVHVAKDSEYLGYIEISDIIKADSKKAVTRLKTLGVKDIVMISGDKRAAAEKVAAALGISNVYAELLPHEKVGAVEDIYNNNGEAVIAFTGDGINDAPSLKRADVGIAMGGIGSDAAVMAADMVIMSDEPSKIAEAVKIARKTMVVVKQNIIFALAVKFAVLVLSIFGLASMWMAVFADVGVALLAVLNAMRSKA